MATAPKLGAATFAGLDCLGGLTFGGGCLGAFCFCFEVDGAGSIVGREREAARDKSRRSLSPRDDEGVMEVGDEME